MGPTGNKPSNAVQKLIIDKLKGGDEFQFYQELKMHNAEVRDIYEQNTFNQNLLFSAIHIKDEDLSIMMLQKLIQQGCDPKEKDNLKQTPLYYAARDGKQKVAKFLIDQGYNVNDIDTYGQNPIFYAVAWGHLELCKFLKAHGSYHDYVDDNGESPMYYAIKQNCGPIAEWLIS